MKKMVETLTVTRIFPLLERQVLMAHVAAPGLYKSWLGLVDLRCGEHRMRMRCVGVGETGGEPAVMLRPVESDARSIGEIVAAVAAGPTCPIYLERVIISSAE